MQKCSLSYGHSKNPFDILDIHLVLAVQLYKSEDTVYTHAFTGGLGFPPRSEGFMHFGVERSFLLSALAGRSCAGVVDPPWPCYEREWRRERWKTEESGYSQVKVFEVQAHSQNQRKAKKQSAPPTLPLSFPLPDNRFRPRPFWLLSSLMGRRAGVLLPFFRMQRSVCTAPAHPHTHWLLGIYAEREGWLGGGGCLSTQWCPILTCSQSINCFFFFYTRCSGRNCMLWIYKLQSHCTLDKKTVIFSEGSISSDWVGVCGNNMLVWRFKKVGLPFLCIAPPA